MQHVHHGSCGCGDDSRGRLDLYSLNESLAPIQIQCLNESESNRGQGVVCVDFVNRVTGTQSVTSSVDQELIFNINFDQAIVQLKGVIVHCKHLSRQPKIAKFFVNPGSEIDFANVGDYKPAHQTQLEYDPNATNPILFRNPVFKNVTSLSIHLSELHNDATDGDNNIPTLENNEMGLQRYNDAHGEIMVHYIGLLGAFTKAMRVPPKTSYEIAPQPSDHSVEQIIQPGLGFGL